MKDKDIKTVSEIKRESITEAAAELFLSNGFGSVSMAVGVKIIKDESLIEGVKLRVKDKKINICQQIAYSRYYGWPTYITSAHSFCVLGSACAGLIEPPERVMKGEVNCSVYQKTPEAAVKMQEMMPRLPAGTKGVLTFPLSRPIEGIEPDCAVIYMALYHRLHNGGDRERCLLKLKLARLYLGEVKNIVDEAEKRSVLVIQYLHKFELGTVQCCFHAEFIHPANLNLPFAAALYTRDRAVPCNIESGLGLRLQNTILLHIYICLHYSSYRKTHFTAHLTQRWNLIAGR